MIMQNYQFLPGLFLRAPFYSFDSYDLSRLPEVLALPAFRNALWLGSPVFYQAMEKKDFVWERLTGRERHTLAKYVNRICFRPTPFGHFASFTLLGWGEGESVQLGTEQQAVLHLLPDNARPGHAFPYQGALLIPNPTLYRLGRAWRYYRSRISDPGGYTFSLDETQPVKI